MTKETFAKGIAIFLSVFRNIKLDKKSQDAWYILLKDLEDERFEYAVKRVCREARQFGYVDNFVAIIRDYAELYIPPERKQLESYENTEGSRIRIEKFKKKLKEEKGIDYDTLGDTEQEKCRNYIKMLKQEYNESIMLKDEQPIKPMKQGIFDIIDNMK